MEPWYTQYCSWSISTRTAVVTLVLIMLLGHLSYAGERKRDRGITRPSERSAVMKNGNSFVLSPGFSNQRNPRVTPFIAKFSNDIQIFYIVQHFVFGEWHDRERVLEVLDGMSRVVEEVYQLYDSGDWINEERVLFQYEGAQLNPSVITWQDWDANENDWVNHSRELIQYDTEGREIEEIYQFWDPVEAEWLPHEKTTITYSNTGEYAEIIFYYWEWDEWEPDYRLLWIHTDGRLIQIYEEWWDGQQWDVRYRITYEYDNDANNILQLYEYYDEGEDEWFPDIRYLFSYDPAGNEIESVLQFWVDNEEEWVSYMRITREYDNRNNPIRNVFYTWGDQDWIPLIRWSMEYDPNDELHMLLGESWTGSEWVYEIRFLFRGFEPVFVRDDEGVPLRFELKQNYPNPFNPVTTIQFSIPWQSTVILTVYDILGREVAVLIDEELHPGTYSQIFDASHLASGVYVYQLRAGEHTETKRLVIVK